MKVTLRKRTLKTGQTTLYLDIYNSGKREYEYLNLYLLEPKTKQDREVNKQTTQLAETIRAERQIQLQSGSYGFKKKGNANSDFLAFFKQLTDERYETTSNYDNWFNSYNHLKRYTNNHLLFKDIDEVFIEGFKKYLLTEKLTKSKGTLAQNSALAYFNKFKAALNRAFELKMIDSNPAKRVKGIKAADTKREYLTIEELKKLSEAECRYDNLKRAFLFSALTGLRWSDINKFIWSELHESEQMGYSIIFKQKKTNGQEYLPITEQARSLLGEKGNPDDRVFVGLKYSAYMNLELSKWVMKAGIEKNITFHCARHTHATLLLTNGTDLYTVSKLLGHKDIKTTQIYAKVIDAKKIQAINSIPDIL